MKIVPNNLVELLRPVVESSDNRSALLEKLANAVGASGAVTGSSAEEQLHSILDKANEIDGAVSVSIANIFGKNSADVFDAIMKDARTAIENSQKPAAKPRAAKAPKAAAPRYGSTASIASARSSRSDHKLG